MESGFFIVIINKSKKEAVSLFGKQPFTINIFEI